LGAGSREFKSLLPDQPSYGASIPFNHVFEWSEASVGIFARLFGKKKPEPDKSYEQSVIVHFQGDKMGPDDDLMSIEERLEPLIAKAGVGVYDGHGIALDGSGVDLYMYGPDADKLFEVVRPVLEATDFLSGSSVKLSYHRYDEEGPEKEITIR
jgi:hypothetical protein